MKYLPLNSFPEFEENPFLENAIQEIQEHTIRKRVFIKGNRSVVNHVVNDNGEVVGYSSFLRNIECDEAQSIKSSSF